MITREDIVNFLKEELEKRLEEAIKALEELREKLQKFHAGKTDKTTLEDIVVVEVAQQIFAPVDDAICKALFIIENLPGLTQIPDSAWKLIKELNIIVKLYLQVVYAMLNLTKRKNVLKQIDKEIAELREIFNDKNYLTNLVTDLVKSIDIDLAKEQVRKLYETCNFLEKLLIN